MELACILPWGLVRENNPYAAPAYGLLICVIFTCIYPIIFIRLLNRYISLIHITCRAFSFLACRNWHNPDVSPVNVSTKTAIKQ